MKKKNSPLLIFFLYAHFNHQNEMVNYRFKLTFFFSNFFYFIFVRVREHFYEKKNLKNPLKNSLETKKFWQGKVSYQYQNINLFFWFFPTKTLASEFLKSLLPETKFVSQDDALKNKWTLRVLRVQRFLKKR